MVGIEAIASSLAARRAYFAEPEHANDRIWTSGSRAHESDFAYLNSQTVPRLIDVFNGMQPEYADAQTVNSDEPLCLSVIPTLMLDSNVAGLLQSYCDKNIRSDSALQSVERFLTWFASSKTLNLSPAYNQIERLARSADRAKAEAMALRTAKAILQIECMDRDYYLKTKEIRQDIEADRILRTQIGTDDLEQIAKDSVKTTIRLNDELVDPLYSFILKVALIDAKSRRASTLPAKIAELVSFIEQRSFQVAPPELSAAMLQFTGSLRKFATINQSMAFEVATDRIRRAAWDLAYMRIPQLLLEMSTPSRTMMAFLLTSDIDAAAVMRLVTFSISIITPAGPAHYQDVDFSYIAGLCQSGTVFDQAYQRLLELMAPRPRVSRPMSDISALTEELHVELHSFLQSPS